MELTQQQIVQNMIKIAKIQNKEVQRKKSLCRFYLRGLCILQSQYCTFSHGVHDINYKQWNHQDIIQYDYLKVTDFNQKNTIKGPRIYKDLYDFQKQKIFTLEELNNDRQKRIIVRKQLHYQLFIDFIKILQEKYPQGKFTEEFLIRQYTRTGFNKLMTKIKFSHLTTFLTNPEKQIKYFQLSVLMPPYLKHQTTFLIKKANDQIIDAFYKGAYQKIRKQSQEQLIDEGKIKKLIFNYPKESIHIPPLNLHLKDKKWTFSNYLKYLLGQQTLNINVKFEADLSTLVQSSIQFLESTGKDKLIQWNEVFKYLSKQHQINNANILNQIKPLLVLQGYRFMFFPMTQFILHPQKVKQINYQNLEQCPCNFKKMFNQQQLFILFSESENKFGQLQVEASYDIYDIQSLTKCSSAILNSKILAVDLQGRLRKNGYIEMIQLNNEKNTFLIDIYRMDLNGDVQTFQLTKKLLRNVLANQKILKIFHDCRHDSLALHQFMQCCIINVFDTSSSQTYKNQIQIYKKLDKIIKQKIDQNDKDFQKKFKQKESKAKQTIAHVNNIKTPGLNEILKNYNAPHGINKNKELFHSMWNKGQTSLFDQRPLNPDFRQYCIKDVLDLPYCFFKMIKQDQSLQFDINLAKWISSQYVKYGYLNTQQALQKK